MEYIQNEHDKECLVVDDADDKVRSIKKTESEND